MGSHYDVLYTYANSALTSWDDPESETGSLVGVTSHFKSDYNLHICVTSPPPQTGTSALTLSCPWEASRQMPPLTGTRY